VRTLFDDATLVEHVDTIRKSYVENGDLLRGQNDQPGWREGAEKVELGGRVERTGRLVQKDELGIRTSVRQAPASALANAQLLAGGQCPPNNVS